jgi:hypothetical protein
MTKKYEKGSILKLLTSKEIALRGSFFMCGKNNKLRGGMSLKNLSSIIIPQG